MRPMQVFISNNFSLQIALAAILENDDDLVVVVVGDDANFKIVKKFCNDFDGREIKLTRARNKVYLSLLLLCTALFSKSEVIFGDFRSGYFKFFQRINIFRKRFSIVDDGSNTLSMPSRFFENTPTLKSFYSIYDINHEKAINCKSKVINYFETKRRKMRFVNCEVLIVGSAEVDQGFMRLDRYFEWINSISTKTNSVLYKPHRRERIEKLTAIELNCACKIVYGLPPLECCDLSQVKIVYGVGSSGFDIISLLWPHIRFGDPSISLFDGYEPARQRVLARKIQR